MSAGGLDALPASDAGHSERVVARSGGQRARRRRRRRRRIDSIVTPGLVVAAVVVWIVGLAGADQGSENELGLLSTMPVALPAALILVAVAFTAGFDARPRQRRVVLGASVAVFAAILHVTPAVLGAGLRNAWARANASAADGLVSTGTLGADPLLADRADWPGPRALLGALADASGADPATIARWAPIVIVAVALGALWMLGVALGAEPRVIFAAQWCYVAGTWVAAPELTSTGVAAALTLAAAAVLLPFDRRIDHRLTFLRLPGPTEETTTSLAAVVTIVFLAIGAVALTNPLLGLTLATTFAVAAAVRASVTWWAAATAAVATLVWALGPAGSALDGGELGALFDHRGSMLETPAATAVGSTASSRWEVVLIAGRFGVQLIVVLALIGVVRAARAKRPATLVGLLALLPFVLAVADPSWARLLQAFALALPWLALAVGLGVEPTLGIRRSRDGDLLGLIGRVGFVLLTTATVMFAWSGQERARDLGGVVSDEVVAP